MNYALLMAMSISCAWLYAADDGIDPEFKLATELWAAAQDNIVPKRAPSPPPADDIPVDLASLADAMDSTLPPSAPPRPVPRNLCADLALLHQAVDDTLPPLAPRQRFAIQHAMGTQYYADFIVVEYISPHDEQWHPCALLRTPLSAWRATGTEPYTEITHSYLAVWPLALHVYATIRGSAYIGAKFVIHRPPDFSTDITLSFDLNGELDLTRSFYRRCRSRKDQTTRLFCLQERDTPHQDTPLMHIVCTDTLWQSDTPHTDEPGYECIDNADMPSDCNTPPGALEKFADAVEDLDQAAHSFFDRGMPAHIRASYKHI